MRAIGLCVLFALISLFAPSLCASSAEKVQSVEQWGLFEIQLKGPSAGNPFLDVRLTAVFSDGLKNVEVAGFYDGEGLYRVRFMPDHPGVWRYETKSNRWDLTGKTGAFTATPATGSNKGPVRVANTYHFAYANGAPFHQIGTTSYGWSFYPEALQERTLKTLAASPFNKLRMCLYPRNFGEKQTPALMPYEGTPPKNWDFTRFNPAFFRHLEQRIGQLRDLGIECDLILFHPYGKMWGMDSMDAASDERYLRYVVARLSAFRNIWWSLANEYDFLRTKTEADWDRFFQIVQQSDPYGHLRSIHNGYLIYNHTQPWVTHASVQSGAIPDDAGRAEVMRGVYRKPIVYDEVKYEGNIDRRWGQLTGQELVHRFWSATVVGTYVGHSECFRSDEGVSWLGQGGELHGESPARLAFLRKVMEDGPAEGIEPIDRWQEPIGMGGKPGEYYLLYFGKEAPSSWTFQLYKNGLANGARFKVEIIDTWDMSITLVEGEFVAKKKNSYYFVDEKGASVKLPGKPFMALRIKRVGGSAGPLSSEPPVE